MHIKYITKKVSVSTIHLLWNLPMKPCHRTTHWSPNPWSEIISSQAQVCLSERHSALCNKWKVSVNLKP